MHLAFIAFVETSRGMFFLSAVISSFFLPYTVLNSDGRKVSLFVTCGTGLSEETKERRQH